MIVKALVILSLFSACICTTISKDKTPMLYLQLVLGANVSDHGDIPVGDATSAGTNISFGGAGYVLNNTIGERRVCFNEPQQRVVKYPDISANNTPGINYTLFDTWVGNGNYIVQMVQSARGFYRTLYKNYTEGTEPEVQKYAALFYTTVQDISTLNSSYEYRNLYQTRASKQCGNLLEFKDKVQFGGLKARTNDAYYDAYFYTYGDLTFNGKNTTDKQNITCIVKNYDNTNGKLRDFYILNQCTKGTENLVMDIGYLTLLSQNVVTLEIMSSSAELPSVVSSSSSDQSSSSEEEEDEEEKSCWIVFGSCTDGTLYNETSNQCLSCSSKFPNCSDCSNSKCNICMKGFYLLDGKCLKCADNCDDCSSATKCYTCNSNAGVYLDSGSCVACKNNCKNCTSATQCTTCNDNFYLSTDKTCKSCVQNCKTCSNDKTCSVCADGYTLSSLGTCYKKDCSINDCTECDKVNTGQCKTCITGLAPGPDKKICDPICDDNRCHYCGLDTPSKCDMCDLPYTMDSNGKCNFYNEECPYGYKASGDFCVLDTSMKCLVSMCKTCGTSNTVCQECTAGYTLDAKTGLCTGKDLCTDSTCEDLYCDDTHFFNYLNQACSACDSAIFGATKCLWDLTKRRVYATACASGFVVKNGICKLEKEETCSDGYAVDGDFMNGEVICTSCSILFPGCGTCIENYGLSQTDSLDFTAFSYTKKLLYTCNKCQNGYAISTAGNCELCDAMCTTCSAPRDSNACTNTGGSCIANCLNCYSGTNCYNCKPGYYMANSTACVSCGDDNCYACSYSESAKKAVCNYCYPGFNLDGSTGKCVTSTCTNYEHCKECTDKECSLCESGYGLFNGRCLACQSNCDECVNMTDYLSWIEKYKLGDINSTQKALAKPDVNCYLCQDGYTLTQAISNSSFYNVCNKCKDGCASCSLSDPNFCSVCLPGYIYNQGNCTMMSITKLSNCRVGTASYTNSSEYYCTECEEGYFLNITSHQCEKCSETCLSCLGPTTNDCLLCKDGYMMAFEEWWNGAITGRSCAATCNGDGIVVAADFYKTHDVAKICLDSSWVFQSSTFATDAYGFAWSLAQLEKTVYKNRDNSTCASDPARAQCSCHGDAFYFSNNSEVFYCYCDPGYAGDYCERFTVDYETFKWAQRMFFHFSLNVRGKLPQDVLLNTLSVLSLVDMDLTIVKKWMDLMKLDAFDEVQDEDGIQKMISSLGNLLIQGETDMREIDHARYSEFLRAIWKESNQKGENDTSLVNDTIWQNWNYKHSTSKTYEETLDEFLNQTGYVDSTGVLNDKIISYNSGDGSYMWPSYTDIADTLSHISIKAALFYLNQMNTTLGYQIIETRYETNLQNVSIVTVMRGDEIEKEDIDLRISTNLPWLGSTKVTLDKGLVKTNNTFTVAAAIAIDNLFGSVDGASINNTGNGTIDQISVVTTVVANYLLYPSAINEFDREMTIKFYITYSLDEKKNSSYYCMRYEEPLRMFTYNKDVADISDIDTENRKIKCEVNKPGSYAIFFNGEQETYGFYDDENPPAPEEDDGEDNSSSDQIENSSSSSSSSSDQEESSSSSDGGDIDNGAPISLHVSGFLLALLSLAYLNA